MSNTCLRMKDLCYTVAGIHAVQDFTYTIETGQIIGLIGPNGAGKTSLFNLITGRQKPDKGEILFKDNPITGKQPYQIARSGISWTYQNIKLITQMTVLENLLLAFPNQPGENLLKILFLQKYCTKKENANLTQALELLKYVQLHTLANKLAGSLSYGQQKLLNIACCLSTGADLLLLDEPLAGVAPEMSERILSIMGDAPAYGKSVFLIEHNLDAVIHNCHKVIFMNNGRIISSGKPSEVINNPNVIAAYLL